MAQSIYAIYPLGTDVPTTPWPDGKPKNATSDAGIDGFPFEELRLSDYEAFFQGVLARQNQTANGVADTAIAGQNLDQLLKSTGVVFDVVADMVNNKFIREYQLIKTRGKNLITDRISMHYLIRLTADISTPRANDVVLTGDSLGFTAVYMGQITEFAEYSNVSTTAWFDNSSLPLLGVTLVNGVAQLGGGYVERNTFTIGGDDNTTLFSLGADYNPRTLMYFNFVRIRAGVASNVLVKAGGTLPFTLVNEVAQMGDQYWPVAVSYRVDTGNDT